MATITLELPDSTPLSALRELADSQNCDLRRGPDGVIRAIPREANVIPLSARRFVTPWGPGAA